MIPVPSETHKTAGDHAGELCLSSHRAGLRGCDVHGGWFELRGQSAGGLPGDESWNPIAGGVLLLGIAGRLCRLMHGRG